MKMPKVSVIVPVYNVEKYLDRCILSLTKQTLKDIEIILVDDDSPDNSPAICEEWSRKDFRIKVIHKKNGGLGMACNSGFEVAKGKYVAFVDSDDWVEEDMYQTLFDTAEKNNAQMVFSGIRRFDDAGNVTPMYQPYGLVRHDEREKINSMMLDMIASEPSVRVERKIPMSAKIVLYDRKMLIENNIRFESERKFISEDLLFNLDCLAVSECVVELPKTFYNYYINTSSLSRTMRLDRFEKALDIREELLHRYTGLPEEFQTRVDRMFIGYSRVAIRQISCAPHIGLKQKQMLIKKVCNHPIWNEIRINYPVKSMPIVHRIFMYCIFNKQITLIILLTFLK